MTPKVRIVDSNDPVQDLTVDGDPLRVTLPEVLLDDNGALITSPIVDYYLHQKKRFIASNMFLAVANNAYAMMTITTGAATDAHFSYDVMAGGQTAIQFFSGTTYTAVGTALTGFNRMRVSPIADTVNTYHTPTILAFGSQLSILLSGAAGKFTASGGTLSSSAWHLAPSTSYLVRVQNLSGAAINIAIALNWTEE